MPGHWLDDYSFATAQAFWTWAGHAGWHWGFSHKDDALDFSDWLDDFDPPEEVLDEVADTLKRLDEELDLRGQFARWGIDEDEILDYLVFTLEQAYYSVDPTQPQWNTMPDKVLMWGELTVPDYGYPEATMEFMEAYADAYRSGEWD